MVERMTEAESKLFYRSSEWHRVRREVLEHDHGECVICKERGRHRKAEIVHHVRHLREYPEYALSKYVNGERQLISVCRDCHENVCHPERMKGVLKNAKEKPLTDEMW